MRFVRAERLIWHFLPTWRFLCFVKFHVNTQVSGRAVLVLRKRFYVWKTLLLQGPLWDQARVALSPKSEFVRKEFVRSGKPRPLKDSEKQITIRIVVCVVAWDRSKNIFLRQQIAQARSWKIRQKRNLTSSSPALMSVYSTQLYQHLFMLQYFMGPGVAQWLMHCATSGAVPGSNPGIFIVDADRTMCPGVNSASIKWVPGILLGVKAAGVWSWQPTTLVVPNVKKSGALTYPNPLEPSRRLIVGETFTFKILYTVQLHTFHLYHQPIC